MRTSIDTRARSAGPPASLRRSADIATTAESPYIEHNLWRAMPAARSQQVSGPTRVFRADAPQEVASASIVASALPAGRDILAIYGGTSYASAEKTVAELRAMAGAYAWEAVVDLTDLPLKEVGGAESTLRARLARTRATMSAVRGMRERVAEALDLAPSRVAALIDQVYVSVLPAASMVTAYVLSPSAQTCCYPHTFISVTGREPYPLEFPRPLWGRAADLGKRVVWGPEAVPTRRFEIDLAITFWRDAPWAKQTLSLGHLINRKTMHNLFCALPGDARSYFEALAADCGDATGLLLLHGGDRALHHDRQGEVESASNARVVSHLVRREQVRSLIVKPHPRIPPERVEEVITELRVAFPDLRIVAPIEYSSLPIEVIAGTFHLVACAGIISTSLCTLPLLYPLRSYCDRAAAENLYGELAAQMIADWTERVPGRLMAI